MHHPKRTRRIRSGVPNSHNRRHRTNWDDFEALAEIWEEFLDAAGQPVEERQAALESIETLTPEVLEVGLNILRPIDLTADAHTYPNFTQQSHGTVSLEDCTLYQPAIQESVTHHHNATAQQDETGNWTITEINLQSRRCVPAQIAQAALQRYETYDEALTEYQDPPNPEHPDIEQTQTGQLLQQTPIILQESLEAGEYLGLFDRAPAEIVEVFAPERVFVSVCLNVDENSGVFDIASRERIVGAQPTIGEPAPPKSTCS